MNKAIGLVLAFALVIGLTVAYVVVNPAAFDPVDDDAGVVVVIDADVPGTKVYCGPHLLGETPCSVTQEQLDDLGVFWDEDDPAATLQTDAWGETFGFGADDVNEMRIMLQAPDAVADQFLAVETPWGRRTKMAAVNAVALGGPRLPKVTVRFQPAATPEGFRFRVRAPEGVDLQAHTFAVELIGENHGTQDVVGAKPEFTLAWGGVADPWRPREQLHELPLPAAWQRIRPGQTVTARYTMNTPVEAGDYSITASFGYRDLPAKVVAATANTANLPVR